VDDRLRDLEQAARRDPADAAAGLAYAGELGRSGDAAGRRRELCRLGRAGVDAGWTELEPPPPRALRARPGRVRTGRVAAGVARLVGQLEGRGLLALAADAVTDPCAVGVDVEGLVEVWRTFRPAFFPAAALGSEVVLVEAPTGAGGAATARPGARSARPSRSRPSPRGRGPSGSPPSPTASSSPPPAPTASPSSAPSPLDPWGERRWTVAGARGSLRCGGALLFHGLGADVEARGLADGAVRWTREGLVVAADARGAVLLAGTARGPGRSVLVDVADGAARGEVPLPRHRGCRALWALTPELLVTTHAELGSQGETRTALRAHARADGALRWTTPFLPTAPVALAAGRDAVYALRGAPEGLAVSGFDLDDGRRLFGVALKGPAPAPEDAALVPLEGALLVAVPEPGGPALARLEA